MTEWVLVVTIVWAIGYEEPDWVESMAWPMPSHEVCIDTATKLFPKEGGNQIQIATCVKREPPTSEWSFKPQE